MDREDCFDFAPLTHNRTHEPMSKESYYPIEITLSLTNEAYTSEHCHIKMFSDGENHMITFQWAISNKASRWIYTL